MRLPILLVALALAGLGDPAAAQRAQAGAQVSADSVARGLEAQYQAALIQERRLADDREQRMLADFESRMRTARTRYDDGVAGAQADLAQARAAYAQLVSEIAARDVTARAEIDAYRAEAQGLAQRATPELLDAYQRFADGDRVGAWPVIEALTQASVRARMAAAASAAAAQVREAANLRAIMHDWGEATAEDVLRLWDQAAVLDPAHSSTHIERARLARTLGDLSRSRSAAQEALQTASTNDDRYVALIEIGIISRSQGDVSSATHAFESALDLLQGLARDAPNSILFRRDIAGTLDHLGDMDTDQGNLGAAQRRYEQALAVRQSVFETEPESAISQLDIFHSFTQLAAVVMLQGDFARAERVYRSNLAFVRGLSERNPGNTELRRDVWFTMMSLGDALTAQQKNDEARSLYTDALVLTRQLLQTDPNSFDLQRDLGGNLERLGERSLEARDQRAALAYFEEALVLSRRLQSSDPSSVALQMDLASSLTDVGDALARGDNVETARERYQESLAIRERLSEASPNSVELQRDLVIGYQRMAALPGGERNWQLALDVAERMARAGTLAPRDAQMLEDLRRRVRSK